MNIWKKSRKQDVLRYVLTANAPETKDNDFTWKDFQARNNNELVAVFGNFINRAMVLTHKYFEGKVPPLGELSEYDKATIDEFVSVQKAVESFLDIFRFRDAQKEAMNLARIGNKYLANTEPWKMAKTDMARVGTILNLSLQIAANLSIAFEPFLPFSAEKLRNMLGMKDFKWNNLGRIDLLLEGTQTATPELLFEKIEDETIEAQVQKLQDTKKANDAQAWEPEPAKENINYDQFAAMDIRIGTILEAELVPKTSKLMKLLIDTGFDKRTVVSGIAEHFSPVEVIGKQVCILVNLEPRKLRGIESQGMILMAENSDGKLEFVAPPTGLTNGSQVK